jgi:hypothetical protein
MGQRHKIEPRLYRESAKKVTKALVATVLVLAGLVFLVDPFQHYRQASFYSPMFDYHRYLNPGVARNFEYDAVIIGTSMTENFVLSHIRNTLGMDAVNLSMPGATLGEQGAVLDVALGSGRLESVLYCMDIPIFGEGGENYRLENFPLHLYDESPLNDYKYLLDMMSIKMLFYVAAGNTWDYRRIKFDPDRAFNWGSPGEFNKANAMVQFSAALKRQNAAGNVSRVRDSAGGETSYERHMRNFDEHLLPRITGNPNVMFLLFYPPYSYLHWHLSDPLDIDGVNEFKRHVFDSTRGLENVRIFDFQRDGDIVLNLDNYKDYSHFSPEINRHIINSMAAGDNLVTGANLESYLKGLKHLMLSVDRDRLMEEAARY